MDAPDITSAQQQLAEAQAAVREEEALLDLCSRPGVVYGPLDIDRTRYLVARDGDVLGYLHHNPDTSILKGWTARPINDTGTVLGPHLTARKAVGALLALLKRP